MSLKRSVSLASLSTADRPHKRRNRASDIVVQQKVSSLLERAQSVLNIDKSHTSPRTGASSWDEIEFDDNLELSTQVQLESFPSHATRNVDMEIPSRPLPEASSDDLFDADLDNFTPEDLDLLERASTGMTPCGPKDRDETVAEDDMLFNDGCDDWADVDFDGHNLTVPNFSIPD